MISSRVVVFWCVLSPCPRLTKELPMRFPQALTKNESQSDGRDVEQRVYETESSILSDLKRSGPMNPALPSMYEV